MDVKVIGRIDPGTCTPTLSGGGTIDYGTMSPSSLAATGYTKLPEKQLDFSITCTAKVELFLRQLGITCTAPSKVAVEVKNGRPNSTAGVTENSATGFARQPTGMDIFGTTSAGVGVAGLGESNGVKVGGYGVRIDPVGVTADSNSVDVIIAINPHSPTATWSKSGTGNLLRADGTVGVGNSWAATGTTTPIAFTNLSGKLGVQAYLNQRSAFDLTNTVQLDGLSTLELVYLP